MLHGGKKRATQAIAIQAIATAIATPAPNTRVGERIARINAMAIAIFASDGVLTPPIKHQKSHEVKAQLTLLNKNHKSNMTNPNIIVLVAASPAIVVVGKTIPKAQFGTVKINKSIPRTNKYSPSILGMNLHIQEEHNPANRKRKINPIMAVVAAKEAETTQRGARDKRPNMVARTSKNIVIGSNALHKEVIVGLVAQAPQTADRLTGELSVQPVAPPLVVVIVNCAVYAPGL